MKPELMPEVLSAKALTVCERQGWGRHWTEVGCYLHLEVSEFIEALRGKGDESPVDEAADVLFVLLSTLQHHGINTAEVLHRLNEKCDEILDGKRTFEA